MTEKNLEMMKKLLAKKNDQQKDKQKHQLNKKIGTGQKEKKNQKTGGSNNKI